MRPSGRNCLTYFIFIHPCEHVTFVLDFILSLHHGDMETLCETLKFRLFLFLNIRLFQVMIILRCLKKQWIESNSAIC